MPTPDPMEQFEIKAQERLEDQGLRRPMASGVHLLRGPLGFIRGIAGYLNLGFRFGGPKKGSLDISRLREMRGDSGGSGENSKKKED